MKSFRSFMLAVTGFALLALAPFAAALDKITLNDGTVIEGEIVEETDAYLVIETNVGGIAQRVIRVVDEIESIERDIDSTGEEPADKPDSTAPATPKPQQSPRDAGADIPPGATRVAFLRTSEADEGKDMVGTYLNGDALSRANDILLELPEEERPDIVVLEIDSGGGYVAELDAIINAIQNEMKRDFRVVAWIRYAISGAAFTAMNAEEIVFMSSGQMGGNVAFVTTSSGTQADRGAFLQEMLEYGRRVARNGRIDPNVMWAMQTFMTLSCDVDEDGRVTWYDDDRGEYIVSPQNKILTLNALDAEKYKISKGTADNKEDLMRVLGVTEWVEVGHEADEYLEEFRDSVWQAEARMNELFSKTIIAVTLAQNARNDEQEVGRQVGKARRYLGQLRSLVKRATSMEKYMGLTPEFFSELDELLREQKFEEFLQRFGA